MRGLLAIAGGLIGAAGLSQYPEFAQQYTQRLAGQVDALTIVVQDFETSAFREGLTRSDALAQMTGTPFLENRRRDMERTFLRHARLSDNLAALRSADPLERLTMPHRLADTETLRNTWGDFQPAVPLTTTGAVSAGAGYLGGWALVTALLAVLVSPFRRRRAA